MAVSVIFYFSWIFTVCLSIKTKWKFLIFSTFTMFTYSIEEWMNFIIIVFDIFIDSIEEMNEWMECFKCEIDKYNVGGKSYAYTCFFNC